MEPQGFLVSAVPGSGKIGVFPEPLLFLVAEQFRSGVIVLCFFANLFLPLVLLTLSHFFQNINRAKDMLAKVSMLGEVGTGAENFLFVGDNKRIRRYWSRRILRSR